MTDFSQDPEERRSSSRPLSDDVELRDSESRSRSLADVPTERTSEMDEEGGILAPGPDGGTPAAPLFPAGESDGFRSRWMEIQTRFVDEPRQSVEEADVLVKEVSDRLVSVFARNRDELERQWSAGDEVSTEDLRRTLQRYRSFFERLLSV